MLSWQDLTPGMVFQKKTPSKRIYMIGFYSEDEDDKYVIELTNGPNCGKIWGKHDSIQSFSDVHVLGHIAEVRSNAKD